MQYYPTTGSDEGNHGTITNPQVPYHPLLDPFLYQGAGLPIQQNQPAPVKIITQPGTVIPAGSVYTPIPVPPKQTATPVTPAPKNTDDTGTGPLIVRVPTAAAVPGNSNSSGSGDSSSPMQETVTAPEALVTAPAIPQPTGPNNTVIYVCAGLLILILLMKNK